MHVLIYIHWRMCTYLRIGNTCISMMHIYAYTYVLVRIISVHAYLFVHFCTYAHVMAHADVLVHYAYVMAYAVVLVHYAHVMAYVCILVRILVCTYIVLTCMLCTCFALYVYSN